MTLQTACHFGQEEFRYPRPDKNRNKTVFKVGYFISFFLRSLKEMEMTEMGLV